MEGIVAKRSLKKSYYANKKNKITLGSIDTNETKKANRIESKLSTYKSKLLFKISLQTITTISILIFVLLIKYLNIQIVKEADITKKIIKIYKTNYELSDIKDNTLQIFKKAYVFVSPVIPSKFKEEAIKIYEKITTKNSEENGVVIYEENSINSEENKENLSIGTSVEKEPEIVTAISSVSSELDIVEKIKATNISFIKPITGTITSHFGAREVIFEGVDSYHTGTDIAANTGSKIVSSTDGTVTVATYNVYNGNYVEVTNGKIVTKYLHMSKISVKKGDKVKAGDKLGEVGSTGLATGPHLHFEIVYDGVKVDPELVLSL